MSYIKALNNKQRILSANKDKIYLECYTPIIRGQRDNYKWAGNVIIYFDLVCRVNKQLPNNYNC